MKKIFLLLFIAFLPAVQAQQAEQNLTQDELSYHLKFLASDLLKGRDTGSIGGNLAAQYIATNFDFYGLKQLPKAEGWFQTVPFAKMSPAQSGSVKLLEQTFTQGQNMIVRGGNAANLMSKNVVVAGYGWVDAEKNTDDYKNLNVRDKVVVVRYGTPASNSPGTSINAGVQKRKWAAEKGAVALIEIYDGTMAWTGLLNFMNRPQTMIDDPNVVGANLPHFWIKPDDAAAFLTKVQSTRNAKADASSSGIMRKPTPAYNVIGMIEGSDPQLKNEYILLTAHYDHVGVGKPKSSAPADSIFNGTRDNAMGTVALIAAAKAFSKEPPKRSVIIIALTAEEKGLLGSRYFAEHPLVDLNKVVFNMNIDGAGYNDTSLVTVIGLSRTTAKEAIVKGASEFGLKAVDDPAPEQNLFDRSDNVNFATKGIPAPTFSEGFTAFDAKIMEFYHQQADQADEKFDFPYFAKFCQAYVRSTRYIADMPQRPFWVAGDKYEAAGKTLYGMK